MYINIIKIFLNFNFLIHSIVILLNFYYEGSFSKF